MDKDLFFHQGRIREAQRQRNEAVGQILADGWHGARRRVARIARAVVAHLLGPSYSQPR